MTKGAIALLTMLSLNLSLGAQQNSAHNAPQLPQESSAGAEIQAAAKAASQHPQSGMLDVLSDTQGVDFGPYLSSILPVVRGNWYKAIPHEAEMQKGKLAIEFKILKSGHVSDMKLTTSTGSTSLDRPAWASIIASDPFPPLPDEFHGPHLALRIRYFYNPDKSDLENTSAPVVGQPIPTTLIQHATLIQDSADSHPIKYPKKAVHEKRDGIVRLVARIAPDGAVESVAAVEGSMLLGDAASQAIRKWRFQPAQMSGKPVVDQLRIRVEFRLQGQRIRSEVFPGEAPAEWSPTQ